MLEWLKYYILWGLIGIAIVVVLFLIGLLVMFIVNKIKKYNGTKVRNRRD